jgi:hypothetical protein
MWVRMASFGSGQFFLLAAFAVQAPRSQGWLIAAIAYGVIVVPAFIAAVRWHHRHHTLGTRGRLAAFAAFPLVIGAAIIIASAVAPAPWGRSQQHYARGCRPAPSSVVTKITSSVHGDFHVQRVVVYGSGSAAAATAVVSGTLTVGGM